jgi:hypothetical protein
MFDAAPVSPVCPACRKEFASRRKDQTFCGRICQKKATNNVARGSRTVEDSPAAKRRQLTRFRRLASLRDHFYSTHPAHRSEFLVMLIAEARTLKELRDAVTQRHLLHDWTGEKATGRLNIGHVLDHFCKEVFGMRSFAVLDPKTELPAPTDLVFPASYFGPDKPPIYEDGIMQTRQCPHQMSKEPRWAGNPPSSVSKTNPTSTYDWRKIGRAMCDTGWQRYVRKDFHEAMPAYECLPQQR